YAPPRGTILLARSNSPSQTPLGCIALRPLSLPLPPHNSPNPTSSSPASLSPRTTPPLPPPHHCEIKRLYVSPSACGLGVGKALVGEAITAAEAMGYQEIRLDTLPTMQAALGVYMRRRGL
ncbi:hypothetical protein K432DRAFT_461764, partial [Lepidopterella palustris CBS 459.81]